MIGLDCTKKMRPRSTGPFRVLWRPVVLLDELGEMREFEHLLVTQDPTGSSVGVVLDPSIVPVGASHDLERLVADSSLDDLRSALETT